MASRGVGRVERGRAGVASAVATAAAAVRSGIRAQAVILAGGEGWRLRGLTRELAGDDRPKQFAGVVGDGSLLAQARRRAALRIPPESTQIVLTRAHAPFYQSIVEDAPRSCLAVQPSNRGTAVAVLYALLRAARRGDGSPVVILPSDHWISDEAAFMAQVASSAAVVAAEPDRIVLLGVSPSRAETQYGWIEPGEPIFAWWPELRGVRRFVEKPGPSAAAELEAGGALWNTFVVVGGVARLLLLYALTLPSLLDVFVGAWRALDSPAEAAALEAVYAAAADADFSKDVLAARPEMLSVLAVTDVFWEDLGDPARVREARQRNGVAAAAGRRPFSVRREPRAT
jgi:mannose-1-phosphate guanylyltransferase